MANQYSLLPRKYPITVGVTWLGDGGRWPLRKIMEVDTESVKLLLQTGRTVTLSHDSWMRWVHKRNARVFDL